MKMRIHWKNDLMAAAGEFVGTTMFLFLALGGAKTALQSQSVSQTQISTAPVQIPNTTLIYIATTFGLSLVVTAFMTGGLFNPAITLALWLIGALPAFRACLLTVAQIVGGIAGAGLVAGLTPFQGVSMVTTTLTTGVSIAQGLWIEAFTTAILVFSVLMLAAEKSRATYMAPLIIGLALMVGHLLAIQWTGAGLNPARSFGPSVVSGDFPGYHWIYWLGPFIGSLLSVGFYVFLKSLHYEQIVFGQDDDKSVGPGPVPVHRRVYDAAKGRKFVVLHGGSRRRSSAQAANGNSNGVDAIDHAEKGQVHHRDGPTVVPFDQNDAGMMEAVRTGEATVVDVPSSQSGGPSGHGDGVATGGLESGTGMEASRQEIGGLGSPASNRGGLASFDRLESVFTSK